MEDDKEEEYDIQIPLDPSNLGGSFVMGTATIEGEKQRRGVADVTEFDTDKVTWLEYGRVHFQYLRDGRTLKAIRVATPEDLKYYRVATWIQSDDIPLCCELPMVFVGQIDDDILCYDRPPNAKLWWHDAASFYVFTCSQCLEVKAVGQQY